MVGTARGELRNDLGRRPGHLFYNASDGSGQVEGPTTQDHNALVTIRPRAKGENLLEGPATDYDGIDAGYELVVAMRFATAGRKKIEIVIPSRDETVDAGTDKDGCCHRD